MKIKDVNRWGASNFETSQANKNWGHFSSDCWIHQRLLEQMVNLLDVIGGLAMREVLFQQGLSPNDERLNALMEEVDSALTRATWMISA